MRSCHRLGLVAWVLLAGCPAAHGSEAVDAFAGIDAGSRDGGSELDAAVLDSGSGQDGGRDIGPRPDSGARTDVGQPDAPSPGDAGLYSDVAVVDAFSPRDTAAPDVSVTGDAAIEPPSELVLASVAFASCAGTAGSSMKVFAELVSSGVSGDPEVAALYLTRYLPCLAQAIDCADVWACQEGVIVDRDQTQCARSCAGPTRAVFCSPAFGRIELECDPFAVTGATCMQGDTSGWCAFGRCDSGTYPRCEGPVVHFCNDGLEGRIPCPPEHDCFVDSAVRYGCRLRGPPVERCHGDVLIEVATDLGARYPRVTVDCSLLGGRCVESGGTASCDFGAPPCDDTDHTCRGSVLEWCTFGRRFSFDCVAGGYLSCSEEGRCVP